MSARPKIDAKRYGKLLAAYLPAVIETEEENELMIERISGLLNKGEAQLTQEEKKLLALMVHLVEDFESRHYELNASTPLSRLHGLMSARDLKPKDLWPVLGSKSTVSQILNGNRSISKAQAKVLASFFHVSPALFI
jgi:HTH-type transcriptional regulator/antitoxin HigA